MPDEELLAAMEQLMPMIISAEGETWIKRRLEGSIMRGIEVSEATECRDYPPVSRTARVAFPSPVSIRIREYRSKGYQHSC